MTDSYKRQKAAQEAEELDLRNGGYDERFILGMRTVKGKIIHVRIVAFCLSIFVLILGPPLASIVLIGVLLIYALRSRNYPLYTRIETGTRSPLSERELFEEQLKYLRKGAVAASAYMVTAVVLIWAVFEIFAGKVAAEQVNSAGIDPLEWAANARQTELGEKLELAVVILFFMALGLIIASSLRWFNLVSCSMQLKKHQPHEALLSEIMASSPGNHVLSQSDGLSSSARKGSKLSAWIFVLALGLPCSGLIYVYFQWRLTPNPVQVSQPNSVQVSQPSSVQVNPPVGACPILEKLQVAIGDEKGYSQSDRYFCIDQTQHLSLLMHDGRLIPLTEEAWRHGWPSNAFVLINLDGQRLNSSEWNSFIKAHPTDQRVTVLSSLCKLNIPVLTDEGDENEDTVAGPEGSYQVLQFGNACASLVQPAVEPAQSDTGSAATPLTPSSDNVATANATPITTGSEPSHDPFSLRSVVERFHPEVAVTGSANNVIVSAAGRPLADFVDSSNLSMPAFTKIVCTKSNMTCVDTITKGSVSDEALPLQVRDGHLFLCTSAIKYETGAAGLSVTMVFKIDRWTILDDAGDFDIVGTWSRGCGDVYMDFNTRNRTVSTSDHTCPSPTQYRDTYIVDSTISSNMKAHAVPRVCY